MSVLALVACCHLVTLVKLTVCQSTYSDSHPQDASCQIGDCRGDNRQSLMLLGQFADKLLQIQQQLTAVTQQLDQLVNTTARIEQQLVEPNSAKTCPYNFTYVSSVNECYRVVLENLDAPSAEQRCLTLDKNAHMLVINSSQEQKAIEDLLNNSTIDSCSSMGFPGLMVQTAGRRIDQSSLTYEWKITAASDYKLYDMTYTNWQPGEPTLVANEGCVYIARWSNYRWYDHFCQPTCFICEVHP